MPDEFEDAPKDKERTRWALQQGVNTRVELVFVRDADHPFVADRFDTYLFIDGLNVGRIDLDPLAVGIMWGVGLWERE